MYTIEDLSKITGLSISIISRYLNGHNVRKENKVLIDEAVKKTGYTPNEFARSLRLKQTKVIGAIVPSLTDSFALTTLHYVELSLKRQGYTLLLADCMNSKTEEIACVKAMIQKRVDALIVLPVGDIVAISELSNQSKIPLIIFDQYFENISADYVLFENKASAYKACDVLLDYGHKDVGIIVGPLRDYTPRQRLKGFKKCMEDHGIEVAENKIFEAKDYSMLSGYEIAKSIFLKHSSMTALFSTNFDMTLGVIKAANELDVKIPDDISLMAFDSLDLYEVIRPKLWTVIQPIETIGEQVALKVLNRISSSDDSPHTDVLRWLRSLKRGFD